jgi:hypothetical protein
MTKKQLKERYLCCTPASVGHYKIGFLVRGKAKYTITTNLRAIDRVHSEAPELARVCNRTYREALEELYNEVKSAQ